MTDEEWKEVEQAVEPPYGRAELIADGYKISIVCMKQKSLKYHLVVYVNGYIKGEWLLNDCEERRRFMRKYKRCYLTENQKKSKQFRELPEDLKQKAVELNTITQYYFDFPSFKSLKSQLIRNNKSIEMADTFGNINAEELKK